MHNVRRRGILHTDRFGSRHRIVFACALLIAATVVAGFVICPKCGYENDDAREACTHCRGDLPGARQAQAAPPAEKPDPEPGPLSANLDAKGHLDPRFVERELQMAVEQFRERNVEMARFLLRNAAALDLLTDPHAPSKHSQQIVKMLKQCDTWGSSVKRRCGACNGGGQAQARMLGLDGRVEYRDVSGRACGECKGSGFVRAASTVGERKYSIGRAMNRYTTIQQGKKFVPIGGAWVPGDIERELSVRQTVQLKRSCPTPCRQCMGVGREDCDECKARGMVKCTNKECQNGMVRVVKEGSLVKATVSRTEKCKVCRGRALVGCEECVGKGSILCTKCSGTGERQLCPKCGGQGLAACRRCGGSGNYKGLPCPTCGGQGMSVCSSCSGDGRER